MENMESKLNRNQTFFIVLLRVLVGWHLAYEGLVKLYNPSWTAKGYLLSAEGPFKEIFYSLAQNASLLQFIDFVNVWGLLLAGVGLILGLYDRYAAIVGASLVFLYYLAHPPLVGTSSAISEGSTIIVNKTLIEAVGLCVLSVIPTGYMIGVQRFIFLRKASTV